MPGLAASPRAVASPEAATANFSANCRLSNFPLDLSRNEPPFRPVPGAYPGPSFLGIKAGHAISSRLDLSELARRFDRHHRPNRHNSVWYPKVSDLGSTFTYTEIAVAWGERALTCHSS